MKKRIFVTMVLISALMVSLTFPAYAKGKVEDEPEYEIGITINGSYTDSINGKHVDCDEAYGVFIMDGSTGKLTSKPNGIKAEVSEAKRKQSEIATGVLVMGACNYEIDSDIRAESTGKNGTAHGLEIRQGEIGTSGMTVGALSTDGGKNSTGLHAKLTGTATIVTGAISADSSTESTSTVRGVFVDNAGNSTITTRGCVTADNTTGLEDGSTNEGIYITNSAFGTITDTVIGDISGRSYGVHLLNNNTTADSVTIICTGTVSGNKAAIDIDSPGESLSDIDIIVFGLESADGDIVRLDGKAAEFEDVKDIFSFIVKDSDSANAYSKFTVGDGLTNIVDADGTTYQTGKALVATTITVTKGYTLSSNLESTLVANEDGTYTLTIPQTGGVILTATLKKVPYVPSRGGGGGGGGGGFVETSKPSNTGSVGNPVRNGKWTMVDGKWTYSTNAQFVDTWGYIGAADGISEPHWYYFDKSGNMLTGWQLINGKWYYFSQAKDATEGMMAANTVIGSDAVGADGAWIPTGGATQPAAVTQAQAAAATAKPA